MIVFHRSKHVPMARVKVHTKKLKKNKRNWKGVIIIKAAKLDCAEKNMERPS